jgi:hypothetical protein
LATSSAAATDKHGGDVERGSDGKRGSDVERGGDG